MNFKKLMIVVVAAAALITVYKFATRVDRTNAVAVATAFTKAVKAKDSDGASKYVVPDKAEAWKQNIDDKVERMHSGTLESYYEGIPSVPAYGPVATVAGKSMIVAGDKSVSLEMQQIDGKWYVVKSTMD